MKQQLSISVKQPCAEDFNSFKPTACGGFCKACDKEVIDFRAMSDNKLISYFKNKPKDTCGIFAESQLKSYTFIDNTSTNVAYFNFLKVASVAVMSLFSLQSIQAQQHGKTVQTVQELNINKGANTLGTKSEEKVFLKGVISDSSSPLPGVNIVLKGTTIGAITNFDGEFEFPKPLREGDILVISYIGFETQNIVIEKNQKPLEIVLGDDVCVLVGKVAVKEVYESKPSLWQKVKSIF
jgi:hypothetical protein